MKQKIPKENISETETIIQKEKTSKTALKDKKLLTIKEMCEYMSISETRARALLSEPSCPFIFRLGGRKLINRTVLDKWIDAGSGYK